MPSSVVAFLEYNVAVGATCTAMGNRGTVSATPAITLAHESGECYYWIGLDNVGGKRCKYRVYQGNHPVDYS